MKKIILMLAMVLPTLASAQKLAYINSQELFAQMPELKVVEQKLDSLNKEYEALLTTMQEEYQKKVSDYQQKQATMTDAIRQISEEEILAIPLTKITPSGDTQSSGINITPLTPFTQAAPYSCDALSRSFIKYSHSSFDNVRHVLGASILISFTPQSTNSPA